MFIGQNFIFLSILKKLIILYLKNIFDYFNIKELLTQLYYSLFILHSNN